MCLKSHSFENWKQRMRQRKRKDGKERRRGRSMPSPEGSSGDRFLVSRERPVEMKQMMIFYLNEGVSFSGKRPTGVQIVC